MSSEMPATTGKSKKASRNPSGVVRHQTAGPVFSKLSNAKEHLRRADVHIESARSAERGGELRPYKG